MWSASAMGSPAERRHRRHDSRVADAAARRRSARRGLRRLRAAAGARHARVRAERHGVPGLRPHARAPRSRNSPSGRRTTSASRCPSGRPRYEGVETLTLAVMGCVVNGPGRVEGREHRDQPARHRRGAELPDLHRRRARRRRFAAPCDELAAEFQRLVETYVASRYARRIG